MTLEIVSKIFRNRILFLSMSIVLLFYGITRLPFFLYYPIVGFDSDTLHYYTLVDQISKGFLPVFSIRTPGYPIFLKFLALFFDTNIAVVYIQSLFSLFTALFLVNSVNKVFGKIWKYSSLFAAIGITAFMTSSVFIISESVLLTESIYVNLLVLFFTLIMLALFLRKKKYFFLTSVIASITFLVRPSGIFLLAIIIIVVLFLLYNSYKKSASLYLVLPFIIILVAVSVYNRFTIGTFSISTFTELALSSFTSTFYEQDESFSPEINKGIAICRNKISKRHKYNRDNSWNMRNVNKVLTRYYSRNRIVLFRYLRKIFPNKKYFLYLGWRPILKKIAIKAIKSHPDIYIKYVISNVYKYFFQMISDDYDFYFIIENRFMQAISLRKNYESLLFKNGSIRDDKNGLNIYNKKEYVESLNQNFVKYFLKEYYNFSPNEFLNKTIVRFNDPNIPKISELKKLKHNLEKEKKLFFEHFFNIVSKVNFSHNRLFLNPLGLNLIRLLKSDIKRYRLAIKQLEIARRKVLFRRRVRVKPFLLQKIHEVFEKLHYFVFRNIIWMFFSIFTMLFSLYKLIKSKFKDIVAFYFSILTIAPIIHGIGICMTTIAILRYSYTMEFVYYLSFFLFPVFLYREKRNNIKLKEKKND